MSDLRSQVEALNDGNTYLYRHPAMPTGKVTELVDRAAVLALIDAHRCYDEAALAEALRSVLLFQYDADPTGAHDDAAAIIERLREGTP